MNLAVVALFWLSAARASILGSEGAEAQSAPHQFSWRTSLASWISGSFSGVRVCMCLHCRRQLTQSVLCSVSLHIKRCKRLLHTARCPFGKEAAAALFWRHAIESRRHANPPKEPSICWQIRWFYSFYLSIYLSIYIYIHTNRICGDQLVSRRTGKQPVHA